MSQGIQPPQPPYYPAAVAPPTNGQALASLILGIVAIAIGFWSIIPLLGIGAAVTAFLPALIAVILGHAGRKRARALGVGGVSALWGLVLGYVTLGIIVLTTLFWIAFVIASGASTPTPTAT